MTPIWRRINGTILDISNFCGFVGGSNRIIITIFVERDTPRSEVDQYRTSSNVYFFSSSKSPLCASCLRRPRSPLTTAPFGNVNL